MSIDRSLKSAGNMGGHRNVLTRAERIARLTGDGRFNKDANDPIHLPKVSNRKAGGGKKKKEAAEGADAAAGAAKPAAGAAAKPAGKK